MATPIRRITTYPDGSFKVENLNLNIPAGYFLAQIGEFQNAPSGNPAVITLRDRPDTIFSDQWQLALYAHNFGMQKNNVSNMMGDGAWAMNSTGVGNPAEPRKNVILEEAMDKPFPRLHKLIGCSLNTFAVREYDSKYYQVWTQDGSQDPLMKGGTTRPKSVADIDSGKVKSADYFFNPQETMFAFVIPNNFNTKPGNLTSISPFSGGLRYSWTPDQEIYQFFPLVSMWKEPVVVERTKFKPVLSYPSPYRRV